MKTRNIAIVTRVIAGDKVNEFTSDRFWGQQIDKPVRSLPKPKQRHHFNDKKLNIKYFLKIVNGPFLLKNSGENNELFLDELQKEKVIGDFFKKKDDNLLLYHTDDKNLVSQIEEGFKGIKKRMFSSVQDTNTFYEPVYQKLAQLCQVMLKGDDIENEIEIKEFHQLLNHLWNGGISNDNLEAVLQTLHTCLTPDGAKKVNEIEGFDSIKDMDIEGEKLHKYINNHLVPKSNDEALSESYIKPLAKMRDVLLSSI